MAPLSQRLRISKSFFVWLASLDTRLLEISLSWMLLTRGLACLMPQVAMSPALYGDFLEIMPESAWGALYFISGSLILAGIIINGRWRRSPVLRMIGALGSAMLLSMLAGFLSSGSNATSLAGVAYWNMTALALWNFFVLYYRYHRSS